MRVSSPEALFMHLYFDVRILVLSFGFINGFVQGTGFMQAAMEAGSHTTGVRNSSLIIGSAAIHLKSITLLAHVKLGWLASRKISVRQVKFIFPLSSRIEEG